MNNSTKYFGLKNYINQIVELTDEEFEDVRKHFKPEKIPTGSFFCEEGQVANKIAFVVKGILRLYYEINEIEVTSFIAQRHMVITAFSSFSSRKPSKEYIQAITDCEALTIDYDRMQMLYRKYPKWQELGRKSMEQIYQHTESRVLSFLSQTAEERYKNLVQNQPRIIKDVPLRYIASMLGITPETLSRIRNKMHAEVVGAGRN